MEKVPIFTLDFMEKVPIFTLDFAEKVPTTLFIYL